MRKREKACPDAATAGQAAEEEKTGQAAFSSIGDFTISGGCGQQLYEFLPHGAANAIPGRALVALLGLHDLRELTKEVNRARRAGVPICASCSGERGYYLATTPAELEQYAKSLDRRLAQVRATRDSVGDMLQRMYGQIKLGEGE